MEPVELKMGDQRYKLYRTDEPLYEHTHKVAGEVSYTRKFINLINDDDTQYMSQTFWHEVLHVLAKLSHVDLEENEVEALSLQLYKFLVDNKYITCATVDGR